MGDEGVATLVPVMTNGVWNVGTNYSEIRAFTGQHFLHGSFSHDILLQY